MKNAGYVSVVFPSANPIRESRLRDSYEMAKDFARLNNIEEEIVKVSSDAYGFVMSADIPYALRGKVTSYGGRFVKFNESSHSGKNAKPSFISQAKVASKSDDEGSHFSSGPKSKSKANQYGSSDKKTFGKIMEHSWLKLEHPMEAYKLEMFGTTVKKSTKGQIVPGDYFVLGIDESNGIATLSSTKGVSEVLFNIDLEKYESQGIGVVKPTPKSPAPKNGGMAADPGAKSAKQSKPGFVKHENSNFISTSLEDYKVESVVDIPVESILSLIESGDIEVLENDEGEVFIYSNFHEAFLVPENEEEGSSLLESILGENDESMADPDMKGGVLKDHKGQLTVKTPAAKEKPKMKQENIEDRRTLESSHSRGLAILNYIRENKRSNEDKPVVQESAKNTQPVEAPKKEVERDEFGLPKMDTSIEARMRLMRDKVANPAQMMMSESDQSSLRNSQLSESLDGLEEYNFED
jgi:hypothetical protein